ncbi:sensor histidine kinase [Ideonella livida]|uniref:Signal transduction histidine kinase subgroup 3 dimerisation and phosphoacceptor domain-containing protein n=1 Tax=Ideonella livida TaxID=2707176 RepID=A0A7C9TI10_9BURK|nr:histidine kinase [Ideonella livida]NDY90798.1 hypothetical protein [Ideonella livida]
MSSQDAPLASALSRQGLRLWWSVRSWFAPGLDLRRSLLRRAWFLLLAGLVVALLGGLLRAGDRVDEEVSSAESLARFAALVSAMHLMDDQQALSRLGAWVSQEELRHLTLLVHDDSGRPLIDTPPAGTRHDHADLVSLWMLPALSPVLDWMERSPVQAVSWSLPRENGRVWSVTLRPNPAAERHEALHDLLFQLGVGLVFGMGLLALLHLNSQLALEPLQRLMKVVRLIARGAPVPERAWPRLAGSELAMLASVLQHLEQALRSHDLERQRTARQVASLQEDERQRVAAELHDELGQQLTGLRVDLAWVRSRVKGREGLQDLAEVVESLGQRLSGLQATVRDLLQRLRPLPLDEGHVPALELVPALAGLVKGWQASAGLPTQFEFCVEVRDALGRQADWPDCHPRGLSPELALSLYRMSQEALTNVARHAQARHARLFLGWTADAHGEGGRLDWQVCDDGVGLADPDGARRRGSGLAGIQSRIWSHGAELACGPRPTEPPCGLCLRASFDLPASGIMVAPGPDPTALEDTADHADNPRSSGG